MITFFLAILILLNQIPLWAGSESAISVSVRQFEVNVRKESQAYSEFLRREAGDHPNLESAQDALGKKIKRS